MLQFAAPTASQFKPPPSIYTEVPPESRKVESSFDSHPSSQSISRPPSTAPQSNTPHLYRTFSSDSGRGSISSQSSQQQSQGLSALASLAANAAAARPIDGRLVQHPDTQICLFKSFEMHWVHLSQALASGGVSSATVYLIVSLQRIYCDTGLQHQWQSASLM